MMTVSIELNQGWQVLQDVHDLGETLGIYRVGWDPYGIGAAVSAWQPIPRLAHLQLLFARQPYFGRELRHFNQQPWWYRLEFDAPERFKQGATLRFEGVDYYAEVWLNEVRLGEHEGYSTPFQFEVGPLLRADGPNLLIVRVSSPWDTEVPAGLKSKRTFAVERNLLKGTYEHADTFIQRDVNPVGIWRPVTLTVHEALRSAGRLGVVASLDTSSSADVSFSWPVVLDGHPAEASLSVTIRSEEDGREVASSRREVILPSGPSVVSASVSVEQPALWSTWDRGGPCLYRAELALEIPNGDSIFTCEPFGIRTVELLHTAEETTLHLNGRPMFLRGTNYFPDVYLSAIDPDRYARDLRNMIRAGINAVRVHVHIENDAFYRMCDQMGLVVIQDFDLNWCYSTDAAFCRRAVAVFEDVVRRLRNHPSIAAWICQNEPRGRANGPMHTVSPGPQLEAAARRLDPNRPVIRSSDVDDPSSGDSHNWSGALDPKVRDYRAIRGTTEKLNTEFGFDAPPCAAHARLVPEIGDRLAPVLPRVAELHDYAYHLHKYFIEHYRRQKYRPCSGFFQFMWIDLGPQSFYGLHDWWGLSKAEGIGGGLRALEESNQPIAVLLDHEARPAILWAINDTLKTLGSCQLEWLVRDASGSEVASGAFTSHVGPDSLVQAGSIELPTSPDKCSEILLTLHGAGGMVLSRNVYRDPLTPPPHPDGHPQRMDHELGMRLYWA